MKMLVKMCVVLRLREGRTQRVRGGEASGLRLQGIRVEPIGWETDAIAPRLGLGWERLPQTKSLGLREIAAPRHHQVRITFSRGCQWKPDASARTSAGCPR